MLKLMYITNSTHIAQIAESAGVDRIFVDLQVYLVNQIDKVAWILFNLIFLDDIKIVANAINNAELLVRVNPIHGEHDDYPSSKVEIDTAIENGAKILMLPYFKTIKEVKTFIFNFVDGRVKTMLLLETPEAVEIIDEILELKGLDEIFIGLNDLSLGYNKKFMFELLTDGTVEDLCYKFKKKGIPYGFGGIASLGQGMLPAEYIITEHYRLGSTCAILSEKFL